MKKGKKEKKELFEGVKDFFFAVKIMHQNAPGYIIFWIFSQFSYWFFTGFIQEILF